MRRRRRRRRRTRTRRRMERGRFRTEDPQIFGATVKQFSRQGSDCVTTGCLLKTELEARWKEAVVTSLAVLTCPNGLREIAKNIRTANRCAKPLSQIPEKSSFILAKIIPKPVTKLFQSPPSTTTTTHPAKQPSRLLLSWP